MKNIIFPLLVAVMTIGVVISTQSMAQNGQKGMGRNMPAFTDCDLNDDGTITEDEFYKARSERIAKRAQEGRQMKNLANAPSFEDIDTNDDGGVSPDEFSAHLSEHKKQKASQ